MIDGLKLMVTGEELQTLLAQRMEQHERCAERWKRERERKPEEQTDEQPVLPEHMCASEAERHEWRADVLGFIRDPHRCFRECTRLSVSGSRLRRTTPGRTRSGCGLFLDTFDTRVVAGYRLSKSCVGSRHRGRPGSGTSGRLRLSTAPRRKPGITATQAQCGRRSNRIARHAAPSRGNATSQTINSPACSG